MRRNLFWLSDEQWRQIEPHLPKDVRGKARVDDRRVIRPADNDLQPLHTLGEARGVGAVVP